MLFFKKKKLLEMDSKLNSIVEFMENEAQTLKKLDKRVNDIERHQNEIDRKIELIFQNNEKILTLSNNEMKYIETLNEDTKSNLNKFNIDFTSIIEEKLNDSQESSNKFLSEITEKNNCIIKDLIELEGRKSGDMEISSTNELINRINELNKTLSNNIKFIDEEIKMLLLNTVMDQI